MELMTVEEIQKGLLEQFEMIDGEIPELNMKSATIGQSEIDTLSSELGVTLPSSFLSMLTAYDFGELNVGGIFFGQTGSYTDFLRSNNTGENLASWSGGHDSISSGLLMIGGTDGYILLLNCNLGEVYAFSRGCDLSTKRCVAANFEKLIQGAGTIHFGRKKTENKAALGETVGEACGEAMPISFWSELAQGIA